LARFPDNTFFLTSLTVALTKLGSLPGRDGRPQLEKALAILKQLDDAGRLGTEHRSRIAWIEARLAKLKP
jgi:hypothetical protein